YKIYSDYETHVRAILSSEQLEAVLEKKFNVPKSDLEKYVLKPTEITEIAKMLLRRAAQHAHLGFAPDCRLDVHILMSQGLKGIYDILCAFGRARRNYGIGDDPEKPASSSATQRPTEEKKFSTDSPKTLEESHQYWHRLKKEPDPIVAIKNYEEAIRQKHFPE